MGCTAVMCTGSAMGEVQEAHGMQMYTTAPQQQDWGTS